MKACDKYKMVLRGLLLVAFAALPTQTHAGGGVPLWTNRYGTFSNDDPTGIAVDRSGNVFVTGSSSSSYATVAYSSVGVPLWTNRYNSEVPGDRCEPRAIAVDSSGNVFVTGKTENTNDASANYVTVAYSSAGMPLWTNRYDGPASNGDFALALTVDNWWRWTEQRRYELVRLIEWH